MLKAVIKNVGEWKAIINAIGNVVEDAMFIVNEDGVTFRGIDPAHIALLDVTFPKASFELLEAETSFFGVKIEELKKIMAVVGNNDVITMSIDNPDVMKISIEGSLNMEFNIRLIEKTGINTPLPKKVDYVARASIDPSFLARILSNIQPVAEYVTINCNSDRIQFSGKGDSGDAKIDVVKGNPDLKEIESDTETVSMFSLEYMAKIIRDIGKSSEKVNLEYGEKNPIHLLFEMPSMASVNYYLAPRVQD